MRTSITLDDDTYELASTYASARGITLGEAVGELIRKKQGGTPPAEVTRRSPNGLPLLPRCGRTITSQMVKTAQEDELA
jgi:hypothetical protein